MWSILSRILLVLLAGLGLLYGALYLLLAFIFWEPDGARPGSAAYLLAIPSTAKRFPLWEPCGRAAYSYRFQDGLSPETYWIDYKTRLSGPALARKFGEVAERRGCTLSRQPAPSGGDRDAELGIACGPGAPNIRAAFSRAAATPPACRPVRVTFVEALF